MGSKAVPWTGLMLFPWGQNPSLTVIPPGPVPEGARVLGVVVLLENWSRAPGARPPDLHPDHLPDHLPDPMPPAQSCAGYVNGGFPEPADPPTSSLVELRPGLHLHPAARQVAVDGTPVDLTRREFDLLRFLAANPHQVHTRTELIRCVWGYPDSSYCDTRTVNIHVMRVRRKLGPHHSPALQTVRGVGYRWSP